MGKITEQQLMNCTIRRIPSHSQASRTYYSYGYRPARNLSSKHQLSLTAANPTTADYSIPCLIEIWGHRTLHRQYLMQVGPTNAHFKRYSLSGEQFPHYTLLLIYAAAHVEEEIASGFYNG